jgi:hypothetical protein
MHMNRAGDNDTPDFDDASQADVSHPVKSCVEDLAIFGGTRLPVTSCTSVGRTLETAAHFSNGINDILDRRWLTND